MRTTQKLNKQVVANHCDTK